MDGSVQIWHWINVCIAGMISGREDAAWTGGKVDWRWGGCGGGAGVEDG